MVYDEPFKTKYGFVNQFVAGWTVGAKTYYRSGEPFSMTSNQSGSYTQLGNYIMAQTVGSGKPQNIASSNPDSCVTIASVRNRTSRRNTFSPARRPRSAIFAGMLSTDRITRTRTCR